jgi:hypothetical protein
VDVIDRLKKLLALAGSPNVHEAALAAARAQTLITRHRLEGVLEAEAAEAEADPVTDGSEAPLEAARKLRKWRVILATELARLNGCVAYTIDLEAEQQIRLAGRAEDRATVEVLWSWLVGRIQWASASAGAGRSRRWHEAFRIGAVDAVVERLRAGDEAARAEVGEALVRLDAALAHRERAVERFVEAHLPLGPGRAVSVDARAYARGKEAGRTLPLP